MSPSAGLLRCTGSISHHRSQHGFAGRTTCIEEEEGEDAAAADSNLDSFVVRKVCLPTKFLIILLDGSVSDRCTIPVDRNEEE